MLRVLLVEDDPGDARLIRELLADPGGVTIVIDHSVSLEEARERLSHVAYDAVLLDLGLPDADGLEGVREVVRAAPEVPVIVLTGYSDADTPLEAVRAGAQDYLSKDRLDPGGLARSIRYAVERKRMQVSDHFLAEAGRLLAVTLDYEETLRNVADLAVRSIADCCIVDILDGAGTMRRLQVAHRDPLMRETAERLKMYELDADRPHLLHRVIESREPLLVPKVDPANLREIVSDEEHVQTVLQLRIRSYIGIPLIAHERLLGTMLFASERRTFDANDLAVAERLGRLAAMEVDNAHHYRAAKEAIRARDRVLGVVAHDLRNPLSAIAMSAELLLEEDWSEEQRRRQIDVIRRSAGRMDRLIEDLLDVARIEGDRLSLDQQYHDPSMLAREAVELNFALATARGLELRCVAAGELPPVLADHDRILQVLTNLIGNALKFTPEGGRISVTVQERERSVIFSVADTGPGIAPEHRSELFEPFWQARRGGTEGAGLGLAIARGIVEAHGGRIWAESEPGEGATLRFSLPEAAERRGS